MVREKLVQFPGTERLLILQASIEDHLANVKLEDTRARYISRAQHALDERKFRDAVDILEDCKAAGVASPQIHELLDFARTEAERQERESLIQKNFAQAQEFMGRADYTAAVSLLQPIVQRFDDTSLRNLLETAQRQQQAQKQTIDEAIKNLNGAIEHQQYQDAIRFLEGQSQAVLHSPAIQDIASKVRNANDRQQAMLRTVGLAYAALDKEDFNAGWSKLTALQTESAAPFFATLVSRYETRRGTVASRVLITALESVRGALIRGNAKLANELLVAPHRSHSMQRWDCGRIFRIYAGKHLRLES